MTSSEPGAVRYFVTLSSENDWLIYREGSQRAIHRLFDKVTAVETAKTLARQEAPSCVMVEKLDGSFLMKYSFDRSGISAH